MSTSSSPHPGRPSESEADPKPAGRAESACTSDLAELEAYRAAVDAQAIVAITDRHGRITYANDLFCAISGYRREELLGQDHRLLNSGWHAPEFWRAMWRTLAAGQTWSAEVCNRAKDGTLYWVDTTIAPLRGGRGERRGYLALRRDITDRKRAEARLEESERRFRALADASPALIWTGSAAHLRETFNLSWLDFTGLAPEAAHGDGWTAWVHPDDLERTLAVLEGAFRSRRPYSLEYRLRRADGAWRWLLERGAPILDNGGDFHGFTGTAIDETDRRRAQDVAEARARMASLLASDRPIEERLGEALELLCAVGHAEGVRAARLFTQAGKTEPAALLVERGELRSPWPTEAIAPSVDDGPIRFEPDEGAETDTGQVRVPLMHLDTLEGLLLLRVEAPEQLDPAHLEHFEQIGELLAAALVRERSANLLVQARERAEQASLTKSRFLAHMSHELRTPMTAVLGYTELLLDDREFSEDPTQRTEALQAIHSAGRHLLTLINDVLDLSRIEAGKFEGQCEPLDVGALLREVERFLAPSADAKGVAYHTEIEGQLAGGVGAGVCGDTTRMRQILLNLVGNAVKFTAQGEVRVSARRMGEPQSPWLQVDVVDTGPGIAPQRAESVFEAFEQGDGAMNRKYGGSGLGLTISRRLARTFGGDVVLVPRPEGQGTHMRLSLPFEPPLPAMEDASPTLGTEPSQPIRSPRVSQAQAPKGALPANPAKLRGRVLLAEDGRDNQRLIRFHLERAGLEVEVAGDGLEALAALENARLGGRAYDLLLTDIQMPGLDGWDLTRALRAAGHRLPVVALTAHAMAGERERALAAGMDDFATKPIDRARLIETLSRWLPA